MKKKIYHIHTDYKFLHDSNRFEHHQFENVLVIIGHKEPEQKLNFQRLFLQIEDKDKVNKILFQISDADLVIFYGLCPIKLEVLNKTEKKYKILWRFFGYELYGKRKDLMLDSETYNLIEKSNGFKNIILNHLKRFKRYYQNKIEKKCWRKIDYILLFCKEEHEFLKKYWVVPDDIQLNIANLPIQWDVLKQVKDNTVIIGNSRTPYNNHLEILKIIQENNSIKNNFVMFFNYGNSGKYSDYVKKIVSKMKNVELIEDFLSKKEFEVIYDKSSALVINSYRQMAMANIFTALRKGVKVYMNEKNVLKDWLDKENIYVFSLNDFKKDIQENNLKLSRDQMKHNIEHVYALQQKNNKSEFIQRIQEITKV